MECHLGIVQEVLPSSLPVFYRPYDSDCCDVLDEWSAEFVNEHMSVLTEQLLTLPHAHHWFELLHNLISNNMSWLLGQLDVPPLLPLQQEPPEKFEMNLSPPAATQPKKPLEVFTTIGDYYKFDHVSWCRREW